MDHWSPDSYHMNPYLYQDNVEDQNYSSRKIPSTAYTAESAYYRTRSASTPTKYSVKGNGIPRERESGRERERGKEERGRDYLQDSGGGYAPDSAESTDADAYDMKAQHRYKKPHSRRPPTSTQAQIAQLEQERALLVEEIQHVDRLKQHFNEKLHLQNSLLEQKSPSSVEYAEIQWTIQRIIKDMYSQVGTIDDQKRREQEWRQRLLEIEHRLGSFKQSRFQPVSSPENSQVSGREESHWSSPPLSHPDSLTFNSSDTYMTDTSSLPPHHHSLVLRPPHASEDSGFLDKDSDVTGSSHATHKRGHTMSDIHYPGKQLPEIPQIFRPSLHRSASTDDNLAHEQNEVPDLLAKVRPRRKTASGHIPLSSLSQQDAYGEHVYNGRYYGYQSPSQLSLSQLSHPSLRPYHLDDPYYQQRKRGSPASSSDTSSIASDVRHRLASGPGSMVSFQGSVLSTSTTSSVNSSRSGSKGILPRPSLPGANTAFIPPTTRFHSSIPEYPRHARSEIGSFSQHYNRPRGHARGSDSDREDETVSMPVLPTAKTVSIVPARVAPPPPSGHRGNSGEGQRPSDIYRRKKRNEHPKIPEETSRDSLQIKIEMVLSVLSVVNSSTKEQNDADAVKFLLALSRTPDTCAVMRQPACMNMLIQIIHNIQHKGQRSHREVRLRAAETMRNIIESTGDTRQGKYELCVLGVLEKIRTHCDSLFEFITSHQDSRRIDPAELESIQADCDALLQPIRKLYKYSSDKEKYRPAILNIGGLQATAEVLIVNFRLISFQNTVLHSGEKPICHSSKIITVIISILINLTYGDVNNKSGLCNFPDFLKSLVFHIRQQNESIIASSAQVLRNLSWRATADIKDALYKCDASVALIAAIKYVSDEPTIQYITSALWNLSAHSLESRRRICSTQFGIKQLVELLSYNSPSGTTAVVENVGGILKNLSVVIMQEEKYRRKFRDAGGLGKLAQHLKSKNKTVLANATGILWNLSARYPEDQKLLWSLGCVPLLDVHATSEHRSIGENARGALRNLLAFGQQNGYSSRSDVDGYNLKTQQGLSKSLSYAANYTFGQPFPQQKHSSESLHSRSSQPLPGRSKTGNGSTSSLTQPKSSSESRRHDPHGYQYPGQDDIDYAMAQNAKNKNKLKLSRIQSAPQASVAKDDDENEWSSYMPYSERVHPILKPYADEQPRRKKTPKSSSSSRGHPYSLSQTLSHSELHAVSMGLSPGGQLSNDVPSSLSALEASFDPSQPERTHEVYAELDPLDLEDDDDDDIDRPIRREEHSSAADLYPAPHMSRRSAMHDQHQQTSGKGGTGKLALDGSVIRVGVPNDK